MTNVSTQTTVTNATAVFRSDTGLNKAAISGIVKAFEFGWATICTVNPDCPRNISIVVASRGRRSMNGYHQPSKWALGQGNTAGEVMIAAEGLNRGGMSLFSTLLHEAAHAIAAARGIKDTSQAGRWHNARYAEIAREIGLRVLQGENGYETYGVADSPTRRRYDSAIQAIGQAADQYRIAEPNSSPGPNKNLLKAVCQCKTDNSLRTSARRLAKGLVCPQCGTYFQAVVLKSTPKEV